LSAGAILPGVGRFVRACPRCHAVLSERTLRCPRRHLLPVWLVVDLRTGRILAAGTRDSVTLGPLLAYGPGLLESVGW
jgi:hypothetical protein